MQTNRPKIYPVHSFWDIDFGILRLYLCSRNGTSNGTFSGVNTLKNRMIAFQTEHLHLAFLQALPKQFTKAVAIQVGEEWGISERAVTNKLNRLCRDCYLERVRHGVFAKISTTKRRAIRSGKHRDAA